MTLREKTLRGVVWSFIQNGGTRAVSFIVFLVLARLLSPEAFGLIALAQTFIAFASIFLDQGFSSAIVQRENLENEHLNTAFWVNIGFGLSLMALSLALAGPVAALYQQQALAPIIRWLSLGFIINSLANVQVALFTRELNFKALAIRQLVGVLAGGVVGVAMAVTGYGIWSLVGQQLTTATVGMLALWLFSSWRPGFRVSARHFKELFAFGINLVGLQLLNFFNRRADDMLIGFFLGPEALGYYTIAYNILLMLTQLLSKTASVVAFPAFSRIQNDKAKMRQGFYKVTKFVSFISFPAFLGLAALAPEMVPLFFGNQWEASVPVMQILAFVGILHSIFFFNNAVIMAAGKPFWAFILEALIAITHVMALLIAVHWGIVAVAAAYLIRGYLFSPIPLMFVKRIIRINISEYLQQFVKPAFASLAMLAAVLISKMFLTAGFGVPWAVLVNVAISFVLYTVMVFIIDPKLLREIVGLGRSVFFKKEGEMA